MYELLLTVHVIAAIVWVGGGTMIHILGRRVVKRGDAAEIARVAPELNRVAGVLYPIMAIVLLIAGLGLVHETGYASYTDAWILVGYAGWTISFLLGIGFYGPHDKRLREIVAEGGAADPGVVANVRQTLMVNQFELLILFIVVIDMTVKPGL